MRYQWQFEGTNITGANDYSLTLTNGQEADTGKYTVLVSNSYGSVTSQEAILTVVATIQITGTVRYCGNSNPVPGVTISLSGSATQTTNTDANGNYQFIVPPNGNYTVTPTKTTDSPVNQGISTVDILLIRRHVLGIDALGSPCQLLAADVNDSRTVTTLDIGLIRRVIYQDTNRFPAGLWRFWPAEFVFTNPAAPWYYPTNRVYANLAADAVGQDFKAIKLGDANTNWVAGEAAGPLSRFQRKGQAGLLGIKASGFVPVTFRVEGRLATTGNTVSIPILVEGFTNVTTVQFTLSWTPGVLEFLGVDGFGLPGLAAEHFSTSRVSRGKLAFSWDDPQTTGVTRPDDSAIFRVNFRVVGGSGSGSVVGFTEYPVVPEVTIGLENAGFVASDGWLGVAGQTGPPVCRLEVEPGATGGLGSRLRLSVPTQVGRRYRVETTESLSEARWVELVTILGDGEVWEMTDIMPVGKQRFYRIRME